jgi:Rps23 Pro-64 3,4-dihydroxylase Tpa1-like proline 4-hydroxylase
VTEELGQNTKVKFKFKESDLFRVYQSIDLGNLAADTIENQEHFPNLLKLKAALYSADYRAFIERIAHLPKGTLTDQVDCAANCHAPGCHLLCHDDVIGTRKISYIIYLTEPEWTPEEGGALELYSHDVVPGKDLRVPQATPSKTILPIFNSMAYFEVKPGTSFHAVQEVFGDRPRLSIQGWYHAVDEPQGMEEATLSRLKSTEKGEDTEGEFGEFRIAAQVINTSEAANDTLSDADHAFLKNYINETYLTPDSIRGIRKHFENVSSVQLRHFLCQPLMDQLKLQLSGEDLGNGKPALDYRQFESTDEANGSAGRGKWILVGPAHKQRFLEYTGCSNGNDMGSLLLRVKEQLFQSPEFGRFLQQTTSLGMPKGHRGRVRRFRPGLDYTVAHYGILTTESVLDATLCVCAGNGEQCRVDEESGELIGTDTDAVWESGDCGGFECYIAADDEDEDGEEAADEYNEDAETDLLSVSASNNTLSLVYRDLGTIRFVKYVGCRAPSSRWDVSMEYELEDTGDDGDDDDENDSEDDDGNDDDGVDEQ